MNNQYVSQVKDLTNPEKNVIYNMTHEEAVNIVTIREMLKKLERSTDSFLLFRLKVKPSGWQDRSDVQSDISSQNVREVRNWLLRNELMLFLIISKKRDSIISFTHRIQGWLLLII